MVAGFIILPVRILYDKKIFKKIAIFSRHKINADTKRRRRQRHIFQYAYFLLQHFYFLSIYPPPRFLDDIFSFHFFYLHL